MKYSLTMRSLKRNFVRALDMRLAMTTRSSKITNEEELGGKVLRTDADYFQR